MSEIFKWSVISGMQLLDDQVLLAHPVGFYTLLSLFSFLVVYVLGNHQL